MVCEPSTTRVVTSRGRSEELEGNAIWVSEAQPGAVRRVLDAGVTDTEFVESTSPFLEVVSIGASECDMVKADVELAEAFTGAGVVCWCRPTSVALPIMYTV